MMKPYVAATSSSSSSTDDDDEATPARIAPHLFVWLQPGDKSDHRGVIVHVQLDGGALLPPAPIPACVRRADTYGLHCIGATPSGGVAFAHSWSRGRVVVFNPVTGASRSVKLGAPQHVLPAAGDGDPFVSSTDDHNLKLSWMAGGGKWTHRTVVAMPCARATSHIRAAAKCNGCFYMLHKDGREVSVVDVTVLPPLFMLTVPVPGLVEEQLPYLRDGLCHLLESDGEVLFVRRLVEYKDIEPSLCCEHNRYDLVVVGFEVFRLDVRDRRWVRVERLAGDQALFVSEESSFAVRASETAGCRSNCIYFVRKTRYCVGCPIVSWHVWGAYSLEEQEVLFERPFIETRRCATAMWFVPNVVV